jgi:hypothetical protein
VTDSANLLHTSGIPCQVVKWVSFCQKLGTGLVVIVCVCGGGGAGVGGRVGNEPVSFVPGSLLSAATEVSVFIGPG